MMKKTLVALAAVAATGGAMAQAVMTGYVAFGYSSTTSSANATASGMGMDDAEINFAISEDIEGVGKLSAAMGFTNGGRGSSATGNDSTIKLTTASGTAVTMGTTKGASYLTGGVAAVGTSYNWDLSGLLFSSRTINDAVSIKVPVMDGVSVSVAHAEAAVSSYWNGTGAAGNGTEQRYNTASLDYAAGALAVNAGYRSYDNTTASSTSSANTRNRAAASYDLGLAKVGLGYESTQYMYGNSKTDSLLGVNVPLGALSLGVQFAQVSTSGNASSSSNYNRNGYLLGANYNLSKQTYLAAQYYNYDGGTTVNPNGYGLFLYKGF
jgi:predicted porin